MYGSKKAFVFLQNDSKAMNHEVLPGSLVYLNLWLETQEKLVHTGSKRGLKTGNRDKFKFIKHYLY